MAESSSSQPPIPEPELPPVVIVDGDVSTQKLEAIIDFGHEQNELDFKKELDLGKGGSKKEKLELVADIAAMAAGAGGYIIIGVDEVLDDRGRHLKIGGFAASKQVHFDISNLRQLIESYIGISVDLKVDVVAAALHGDKKFGVICVMPAAEFPVVMSKDGAYGGSKGTNFAFKEGDILVRRNASTVRANQADVREIVSRIRRSERARLVNELSEFGIPQLLEQLRDLTESLPKKKGARRRRHATPSRQLILGSEDAFQDRFLDMLEESADE